MSSISKLRPSLEATTAGTQPSGQPLLMTRRTAVQAAAALGGSCWALDARPGRSQDAEIPPPEQLSLETRDRVKVHCTFYPGTNGKKTVPIIMIHDFKGRRTEYDSLAKGLQKARGHAIIVPDLRGHGESTRRRTFDGGEHSLAADDLKPVDFVAMVELDLEKVKGFLVRKNNAGELNIEQLCVIAAGPMGSVVGLNWIAKDWNQPLLPTFKQGQDVKAMVLLSPATNFKALKTQAALNHPFIGSRMSTLLIGAEKESDIKTIYNMLKRKHVAPPSDEGEAARFQDLWFFPEETQLQGTKLLRAPLGVDRKILQFIDLRLVNKAEDFEWTDRTSPLDK